MRRIKMLCLSLVALAAVASIGAASALASGPTVLVGSGEALPVELTSVESSGLATQLQTPLGTLKGTGLSLKVVLSTSNSGKYNTTFTGVEEGTTKCNTPGAASGEVVVPEAAITLVYDALGTELGVGTLFSVKGLEILCGSLHDKVEGTVLGLITPLNTLVAKGNTTTIKGSLRCKNSGSNEGVPAEESYWNSSGTLETAKLQANLGAGTEKGCELIGTGTTGTVSLSPNKAIELMG